MAINIAPGVNPLEFTHFTTGDNPSLIAHVNPPFTFFARVKPNIVASPFGAAIIKADRIPGVSALPGAFFWFMLGLASDKAFAQVKAFGVPTIGTSVSTTSLDVGTWYNITGVFRNSTFRQVWVDGVSGPSNATSSAPSGLDGLLIGASHANYTGAFNKPLTACVQDVVCWRRELTTEEIESLNDLEDITSLHQTDIFFHVPFVDAGSATVAWDYTSGVPVAVPLIQDGTGGAITTCNDSPEFPEPPEEGDCIGEDVADEAPVVIGTWPTCDLVPEDIDVQFVSETSTPGRAMSGRQQFVQRAAGHWRIEYIGIPIWTKDHVLQARRIETDLDGRNGTILIPFYEGKLSATPVVATAADDFSVGDVRLVIAQTAGATIRAGQHFSTNERGYRIKRVLGTDGDGLTSVIVLPPLRDAIAFGASLNFNDPSVRCRLERDDGMAVMLEHLKFGKHTVAFVEDV